MKFFSLYSEDNNYITVRRLPLFTSALLTHLFRMNISTLDVSNVCVHWELRCHYWSGSRTVLFIQSFSPQKRVDSGPRPWATMGRNIKLDIISTERYVQLCDQRLSSLVNLQQISRRFTRGSGIRPIASQSSAGDPIICSIDACLEIQVFFSWGFFASISYLTDWLVWYSIVDRK